ncbi:MAG: hypothetical protein JW759_06075 [Candidatus Coatesbacteria bacterium]|nr:hypothetical protein [Candidatus Coatesbacteria bacterium]
MTDHSLAVIARRVRGGSLGWVWAPGALIMVGVYFAGEYWVFGMGPDAFAAIPINLLQAAVGGVVGIPLCYAVRRAYPPVTRMAQGPSWREE